jgi:hypothetical protein
MEKCLANISIAELFEQYFRGINASDEWRNVSVEPNQVLVLFIGFQ